MTEFGLTKIGFTPKRYPDILKEKELRARELFGAEVNLTEASPLGMLIRLNAWDEAMVWQQLEEVYLSAFVSSAEGLSLDRKCQDIGIMRHLGTRAHGTVKFAFSSQAVVHSGTELQTANGVLFRTILGLYYPGGLSIPENPPPVTEVPVEAVVPGVNGNVDAGTITRLVSPIAGVTGVTNLYAMSGGMDTESDAQLRGRYLRSVAKPGGSSAAAIEAAILDVDGVLDVDVRQNTTMSATVDGIPPKSIAPVVWGGVTGEIAQAIFAVKPAGIQCWGEDEVATITDSRGVEHMIGFDRPDSIVVDVDATLVVDALYPLDGDDQVETAIEMYLTDLGLGDDVIYTRLISRIHSVPGIVDITALTANLGTTNIPIDETEVAVPGTITVVSS